MLSSSPSTDIVILTPNTDVCFSFPMRFVHKIEYSKQCNAYKIDIPPPRVHSKKPRVEKGSSDITSRPSTFSSGL